jgi:hypothetical protein
MIHPKELLAHEEEKIATIFQNRTDDFIRSEV